MADRGHHPGPGPGHPGARTAGPAAVLARRHPRPARRAGPGHRGGLPRAGVGVRVGGDGQAGAGRPGRAGGPEPDQVPGRPARGHRVRARRPDPGRGAVPRRARRLAGGAAQPVRRPGARAVGAGHRGPAARAVRRDGRAGAAHRRRDPDPGAGRRRAAAERDRAARPGRDRRPGHGRGRGQRAVRVAVPGVRQPGAAAAAAPAGPPHPAVAAAAAVRAAAGDRQPVPGVPDRAGDGPGGPAGRVRRPGPDRAAAGHRRPPDPDRGGGDGDAEPVRQVAAVPVRRGVHVRGRRAAGRAARAGPVAGPGPAGRTARPGRAARAARSRRGRRDRA